MAKDEKAQYSIIIKIVALLFIILLYGPYAKAEQIKTENGLFSVETDMDKASFRVGENITVKLILRDTAGKGIEGASVKATPWMTEHGHGSGKKTRVQNRGGGLYIVENVYFTMKGKWSLIVEIEQGGRNDSAVITFPKIK